LTDHNQEVSWAASYTPFGKAALTTAVVENNLRFAGQYFDSETGLHYNYFRYYDPQTGRYTTSDPIGLAGGINTYGYVYNNPLLYTDSKGLLVDTTGVYTGAVAAGAATGTSAAVAGVAVAGGVGVAIGLGINYAIDSLTGQPLGSHIYDWLNPEPQFNLNDGSVDTFPAQSEYLRYKDFCGAPPPPTGNRCEDMRSRIKWLTQCRNMRQQWDDRYKPGRHSGDIDDLSRTIKKLKKRYGNAWECKDQPLDCD